MKTIILLFSALIFPLYCSARDRASQLDEIREATFRYQFTKNASAVGQNAKVYFLSIYDPVKKVSDDPTAIFLQRFAEHKPRVAKASESKSSMDDGVRDKKTGEQGLIFEVGEIRWISEETVEVSGGYYEAGLSASGNTYYLKMRRGKWMVERDAMEWISSIPTREHSPDGAAHA